MLQDVDECSVHSCSRGSGCCSGHGTCRNLIGNWTCDCSSGYQSVYHSYRNITCEGGSALVNTELSFPNKNNNAFSGQYAV